MPYTITGPYLSELFRRAFTDALHTPAARPTADEWETALVKTVDLAQPCANSGCAQGWYVFDNTRRPVCPYCGTPYAGRLPVLNLYSSHAGDTYRPDNHRLMVYPDQSLFPWHIDRTIFPNERLTESGRRRVGHFVLRDDHWHLINEHMPDLFNVVTRKPIPAGESVVLEDGMQLLLSRAQGGRLAVIQMVND